MIGRSIGSDYNDKLQTRATQDHDSKKQDQIYLDKMIDKSCL